MSKTGIGATVLGIGLSLSGGAWPAFGQFTQPQGPAAPSAAPNIEGLTVTGKGTVSAKPDLLEIDLQIGASSELSADAIVKYRDARRKLREAFAALKLPDVALEERGLAVEQKSTMNNPYFFGSSSNQRTKTEVQLSRRLVVRGTGIRKMEEDAVLQLVARLLDVAQDAGGHVGPPQQEQSYYYYLYNAPSNPGLARFVIEDLDKLEEEAYAKAFADARSRATRLARISNVELGAVVAIRELVVPGEKAGEKAANDEEQPRKRRLETSRFQEIPIRVELLVRFEVHARADGKERTAQP